MITAYIIMQIIGVILGFSWQTNAKKNREDSINAFLKELDKYHIAAHGDNIFNRKVEGISEKYNYLKTLIQNKSSIEDSIGILNYEIIFSYYLACLKFPNKENEILNMNYNSLKQLQN